MKLDPVDDRKLPPQVTKVNLKPFPADSRTGEAAGTANGGGEVSASPKEPPKGNKAPNPAPQANSTQRGHKQQRKGSTGQKAVTPPGTLVQPGNHNKAAGVGGGWHTGAGGRTDSTSAGQPGQGGWSPAPNHEQGAGWLPFGAGGNHNLGGWNTARGGAQDTSGAGHRKGAGEGWGDKSGARSSQGRAETGSGQRASGHGRMSGGQQAPNHMSGGQRAFSHGHTSGGQQASSHGHTSGSQHASSRGHTSGSQHASSHGHTNGGQHASSHGHTSGGHQASSHGHTSGGQHASSHGHAGGGQPASGHGHVSGVQPASGHGHTSSLHAASGHGHAPAHSAAAGHSSPAGAAAPAGHPSAADRVHDAGQPSFNAAGEVYTLGGIGQAAAQRSAGGESGGIHAIHPASAAGGVSVGHSGRSGASRGLTGGGEAAFSGGGDGQPFLDGVSIAAQDAEAEDWAKVAKVKPGGERLLYLAGANDDRLRVPGLTVIASMRCVGCSAIARMR